MFGLDARLRTGFRALGCALGHRPRLAFVVPLVVCAALSACSILTEVATEYGQVWYPRRSRAWADKEFTERYWTAAPRVSLWIGVANAPNTSAISKAALVEAAEVHRRVAEGGGFPEVCRERGGACDVTSVLSLWGFDPRRIEADGDVLGTITRGCVGPEAVLPIGVALGGVTMTSEGRVGSAEATQHVYRTHRGGRTAHSRHWENHLVAEALAWADDDEARSGAAPSLAVHVLADRSYNDEMNRIMEGDTQLMGAAVGVMIVYVVALFWRRHLAESRVLLGCMIILCVGLALGAAFGIAALVGLLFSEMSLMAVFIMLGVGIDDMLIVTHAFDRASRALPPGTPVPRRVGEALAEVGPSVLLTSITDFAAFVVGAAIDLPAISNFCVTAGIAVVVIATLLVTLFVGALVLDTSHREGAAPVPAAPVTQVMLYTEEPPTAATCKQTGNTSPTRTSDDAVRYIVESHTVKAPAFEKGGAHNVEMQKCGGEALGLDTEAGEQEGGTELGVQERWMKAYSSWLLQPSVRGCMIVLCLALDSVLTWYGFAHVEKGANWASYLPPDSYLLDFYNARDLYFGEAGDLYVYTGRLGAGAGEGGLVWEEATCRHLHDLSAAARDLPAVLESACDPWWEQAERALELPCGGGPPAVREWLEGLPPDQPLREDVVWGRVGGDGMEIVASRMLCLTRWAETDDMQVDEMKAARAAVDATGMPGARVFADHWLWLERYDAIIALTIQSLLGCVCAVAALTVAFLSSPGPAAITTAMVALVCTDMLGVMPAWDIQLNVASLVNLVLAVGFAVDYSAHVAQAFDAARKRGSTRLEAADEALVTLGGSVVHGGFSTLLAVLVLAFSQSRAYSVLFKMFLCMVTFGLLHGLVFLPAILATIS